MFSDPNGGCNPDLRLKGHQKEGYELNITDHLPMLIKNKDIKLLHNLELYIFLDMGCRGIPMPTDIYLVPQTIM